MNTAFVSCDIAEEAGEIFYPCKMLVPIVEVDCIFRVLNLAFVNAVPQCSHHIYLAIDVEAHAEKCLCLFKPIEAHWIF